jgi:hypothetical protein
MNTSLLRSGLAAVAAVLFVLMATSPCARSAEGAATLKAAPETEAGKGAIEVSIAIPLRNANQERELNYLGTRPHFHVLVTNVSDQPQRVWREWCSWGYFALSFEVTDADGKTRAIIKNLRAWTRNFPDYWTIPPHESLVLEVDFADTSVWQPFPHPEGDPMSFTMQAVFEIPRDKETEKDSVWTGRVVSKAVKCTAYAPR